MRPQIRVRVSCFTPRRRRNGRRGYIVIAFTLALPFLLGMVGLAVDLGTMYTTKNEAQSFVDSAAMDAARHLNGSQGGVAKALNAVAANPKLWLFGTSTFASVTTGFGTSPVGPFLPGASLPNPPEGYLYARVATQVNAPLHFLPLLVKSTQSTIGASAVAGRSVDTNYTEGLFPFSPFSHNIPGGAPGCTPGDENDPFGYKLGGRYTLRWAAGGIDPTKTQDLKKACPADACPALLILAADMPEARGFIMLNAASGLRDSIVSDAGYFDPLTTGTSLLSFIQGVPPGSKNTEMDALGERVAQDTDSTSQEYGPTPSLYDSNAYKYRIDNDQWPRGNGRRLVTVPINGGNTNNYTIVGFARFFLDSTQNQYRTLGGNEPGCGEYLGAVTYDGAGSSGGGNLTDTYLVRLYQ
jgi:Flp pilus assembly protein TadG